MITITGAGDHDRPEWLITMTGIRSSMKGWDKARQRGVYQPFILIMQILALLVIHLMSRSAPWSNDLDLATLAFVPVALLGTWFGLLIFRQLSERQFDRMVNLLLAVSGVGLVA
jgi:uncharacterized membrane protein YfcA